MTELTVGKEENGTRLDAYLRRFLPRAGSGFLYKMLRKKNIVLNGGRAEGKERLREGDVVTIYFSEETVGKFRSAAFEKATNEELSILYEDEDILAADKEAGLLTQGDARGIASMTDRVTGYLLRSGAVTEESLLHFRPSPANRLDRNTSGIVLYGKTIRGMRFLSEMIRERKITKTYTALAAGRIDEKAEDRAYLRKDERTNTAEVREEPFPGASLIETVIDPVRPGDEWSLVSLTLRTGRPHQLRARLSYLGHPVAGDPKYGDPARNRALKKMTGLGRQFLHASEVRIPSRDGASEPVLIRSPLPEDLSLVLNRIYGTEGEENRTG